MRHDDQMSRGRGRPPGRGSWLGHSWGRLVAVVLAAILGSAVMVSPAQAATFGSHGAGVMKDGDIWYGSYKTSGNERGFCGDPNSGGEAWFNPLESGGSDYGPVQSTTSWNTKTTGVGAMSPANVQRLAYILATSGDTNSDTTAAQVSWAVRKLVTSAGGAPNTAMPDGGDFANGGQNLIDEATDLRGPYTIPLKLTLAANGQSATVTDYRPLSATDKPMTGYAGTLTLTGPGTFGNGTKTMTAPAGGASVKVTATGDGQITVKAAYNNLPSDRLWFRSPDKDQWQRLLITGTTEPVTASKAVTVNVPNQPSVATQTSTRVATTGATLTDQLTVSGLEPNSTVTVTSVLYGPFTSTPVAAATPPAGAPVAGTVTTSVKAGANGTATATTPGVKITAPGFYSWFETTTATPENLAWPGRFGQASETSLVKWTPQVTTQTSDQRATPGAVLTDTLKVTGLQPGAKVTVSSTLYGPFVHKPDVGDEIPADAPKVGTVTTEVTGDAKGEATATTAGVKITEAGFYVWHETIPTDATHDPRPGEFGQETETSVLPWQPTITTQTSDAVVEAGSKITDTLTVAGLQPGASLEVTTTLYGPFVSLPEPSKVPPADAPVVGTLTLTVTGDDNGDATVTTDPLTVEAAGFYVWHETTPETDVHEAWVAPFGQTTETTLVPWSPKVATKTSGATTSPGSKITDTLTVSGLQPGVAVEVETTLYGPFTSKPVLADAPPKDAPVVGTVKLTVTGDKDGNATVTTGPLTVKTSGYYVWRETISESETHHSWEAPFGQATETTLVPWSPKVSTKTSDQTVVAGDQITDTLTVAGLRPGAKVQIESTLYGPFTTRPALADNPPKGAHVVGTVKLTVTGDKDGNATITTKPLTVKDAGYYVWREVIKPTDEHTGWEAEFGQKTETTYAAAPPVPVTPGGPGLPNTGAPSMTLPVLLAVMLLLAGGTALTFTMRRRNGDAPEDLTTGERETP